MEVALLKAKLADARSEIRNKDQELAVLDAELQSKIRSMETVPEDTPVKHYAAPETLCSALTLTDNDQWSAPSFGQIQSEMASLRKEVQLNEARLASQLAGLSAGARALAAQLAHEREERTAVLAEVRRDFEDLRTLLHDTQVPCWQSSFDHQAAHADMNAEACLPSHLQEASDLELAKFKQNLEAAKDALAAHPREAEALSDQFVCKNDPQWLQASETMVRLSETCGQLCAEVSLLTARLDDVGSGQPQASEAPRQAEARARHHGGPAPAEAAEAVGSSASRCCAEALEASTVASLAEGAELVSTRELTMSLKQVEKEVAVLAKAIISGQQEMTVRLGEERSVRRAAEAVLDARIKTMEHQVKRRGSNAGFTAAGDSPGPTPVLTPAVSAACLPVISARTAIGAAGA